MGSRLQQNNSNGFFYNLIPVQRHERQKVIILCVIKALASCAFIMLKIQKANNIVTGQSAEQLAFVKSFVFPMTLLLIAGYTSLSNILSPRKLFYTVIFFFAGIFVLYSFILVPYEKSLSPNTTWLAQKWQNHPILLGFLNVYKYWLTLLFYCLSELFGQFFIILLFWGLANEIFTRQEAKRIYHLFIAAGCLGSMIGTSFLNYLAHYIKRSYQVATLTKLEQQKAMLATISQYIGFVCLGITMLILLLYRWLISKSDMLLEHKKEQKKSMTFFQALRFIASNSYLIAITLLVVSCAITTSLVDITYQKYLKCLNLGAVAYQAWIGYQVFWINVLCVIAGFFITHWVSRHFSWKFNAYVAPTTIIFIGVVFFGMSFLNYRYSLDAFAQQRLHMSAYKAIALLGFFQNIISVFVKYVFFDTTKEILFIGLSAKARAKVKGSVDVVGSRLGKGISSYIHMLLLAMFSLNHKMAVERVSHVLLLVFLFFGVCWFFSIRHLAPKIDQKETKRGAHSNA